MSNANVATVRPLEAVGKPSRVDLLKAAMFAAETTVDPQDDKPSVTAEVVVIGGKHHLVLPAAVDVAMLRSTTKVDEKTGKTRTTYFLVVKAPAVDLMIQNLNEDGSLVSERLMATRSLNLNLMLETNR